MKKKLITTAVCMACILSGCKGVDVNTDIDTDIDVKFTEGDAALPTDTTSEVSENDADVDAKATETADADTDQELYIETDEDTLESVIHDGDKEIPVEIATGVYGPYIKKYDVDGDGEDEYVIAECEGTGTGMSIYGLCIVEIDNGSTVLTTYDGQYFTDILYDRIETSYDKASHEVTVTAKNEKGNESFSVKLEREEDLYEVYFGDIIRIRLEDDGIYLSAPTGYIFEEGTAPDYEQAVDVSGPITVDKDSNITVGDLSLGEDDGDKTP